MFEGEIYSGVFNRESHARAALIAELPLLTFVVLAGHTIMPLLPNTLFCTSNAKMGMIFKRKGGAYQWNEKASNRQLSLIQKPFLNCKIKGKRNAIT
jgi:hypothetical protein